MEAGFLSELSWERNKKSPSLHLLKNVQQKRQQLEKRMDEFEAKIKNSIEKQPKK